MSDGNRDADDSGMACCGGLRSHAPSCPTRKKLQAKFDALATRAERNGATQLVGGDDLSTLLAELDAAVAKMTPGPWSVEIDEYDTDEHNTTLLAELDAAVAKMTPGPWSVEIDEYDTDEHNISIPEIRRTLHDSEWADVKELPRDTANAHGIVALVNAYPRLREGIEQLQREKATDAWHTGWQVAVRERDEARRECDEARAERNARARDVMHVEGERDRLREQVAQHTQERDYWKSVAFQMQNMDGATAAAWMSERQKIIDALGIQEDIDCGRDLLDAARSMHTAYSNALDETSRLATENERLRTLVAQQREALQEIVDLERECREDIANDSSSPLGIEHSGDVLGFIVGLANKARAVLAQEVPS